MSCILAANTKVTYNTYNTATRNVSVGQAVDSGLWDQYMPFYDLSSPDVRCGRGASISGPGTKTATVRAGDEIGFVIGRSADEVPGPLHPSISVPRWIVQANCFSSLCHTSSTTTAPDRLIFRGHQFQTSPYTRGMGTGTR